MIVNRLKTLNMMARPGHLYYAPSWLVLGVNNLCNLHCKMCDVGIRYQRSNFYQNLMGSRPLNMPEDLIKIILDQAAFYFPQVKIGFAFTEPLIYPHLISSLHYAQNHLLHTAVTTNALNLPQKAVQLCEAGLNELFISLDGPQEIHNQIRGHKSSFQKAIAGIEKILSHTDPPKVSVYCVITQWNIGHLESFLKQIGQFPLKQIGFMHTNFTTEDMASIHNTQYGSIYPATASNMEEIDVEEMDLDILYKEIARIKSSGDPRIMFSPDLSSREDLEIFYHRPQLSIGKRCHDVFRNLMVKSDGSVIPAHGRCYNINLGSLYEHDLEEIWNSGAAAKFRKTLVGAGGLLPACTRCCSAF